MNYKTLKLDAVDNVGTLTLNRPQTLNAITPQFFDELGTACEELAQNQTCRALILTANGRGFCSGLDVSLLGQIGTSIAPEELPALIDHWQAVFTALESVPQITVAAINGITLGAGVELILCADFRIASSRALFGMPEVKLGMVPDLGGLPRLVRTVGPAWAKEILLRARNFSAMEAVRVGLINRVADHGDLMGLARKWANGFADLPPSAARVCKSMINSSFDSDFAAMQARAKEEQLRLLANPEFAAAIQVMRQERGGERAEDKPEAERASPSIEK